MATFGQTSRGASSASNANNLRACKFQCSENGTGNSITFWWVQYGGAGKKAKCAIYEDDPVNDEPDDLLTNGVTEEYTTTGNLDGSTPITLDFPVAPTFVAATYYWLVSWTDYGNYYYDTDAHLACRLYKTYDGSFPANFGNPTEEFIDQTNSIYCTYTPSGGGLSIPVAMHTYRNLRTAVTPLRFPKLKILRI